MAEFDYAGLVNGLETLLQADTGLRVLDAHVTQELDEPTEFPWVQVKLVRSNRVPFQIVAGIAAGAPDDVTTMLELICWAMSAQGAADAARQRDILASATVDALRRDYTVGGRCAWVQVEGITFADFKSDQGGIYSSATLSLAARELA